MGILGKEPVAPCCRMIFHTKPQKTQRGDRFASFKISKIDYPHVVPQILPFRVHETAAWRRHFGSCGGSFSKTKPRSGDILNIYQNVTATRFPKIGTRLLLLEFHRYAVMTRQVIQVKAQRLGFNIRIVIYLNSNSLLQPNDISRKVAKDAKRSPLCALCGFA